MISLQGMADNGLVLALIFGILMKCQFISDLRAGAYIVAT